MLPKNIVIHHVYPSVVLTCYNFYYHLNPVLNNKVNKIHIIYISMFYSI